MTDKKLNLSTDIICDLAAYTLSTKNDIEVSKINLYSYLCLKFMGEEEGFPYIELKNTMESKYGIVLTNDLFKTVISTLEKNKYIFYDLAEEKFFIGREGINLVSENCEKFVKLNSQIDNSIEKELEGTELQSDSYLIVEIFKKFCEQLAKDDAKFLLEILKMKKSEVELEKLGLLLTEEQKYNLKHKYFRGAEVFGVGLNSESKKEKIADWIFTKLEDPIYFFNNLYHFFIYNVYGTIIKYYLISENDDGEIKEFFKRIEHETQNQYILIDTSTIISLTCHLDNNHRTALTILDFLSKCENIKFAYLKETDEQLKTTLKRLKKSVHILTNTSLSDRETLIDELLFTTQSKSPIMAYFIEDKYKDWEDYVNKFLELWGEYIIDYNIQMYTPKTNKIENDIKKKIDDNIDKLLFIGKSPKNLIHDMKLLLIVDFARKRDGDDKIIHNFWVWTQDNAYQSMENILSSDSTPLSFVGFRTISTYLFPARQETLNKEIRVQVEDLPFVIKSNELNEYILANTLVKNERMDESGIMISASEARKILTEPLKEGDDLNE
ncbi:hypothetical protein K8R66_04285 [bacterium]|nr:hypothetical protein [bacterium]